ncbi:MAG: recombinase family protein, partial [Bradyrhizobiaceae bacterium]
MKLKAYSYIRMSTETQLQGDSLRRQTVASRRYAEAHGLELVTDVDLHDIGVSAYSGDNVTHGKFGRFLEAVRAGQIEKGSYLLVESFDRISRQTPLTALESFKAIVEAGLVLVTLDDGQVYRDNIRTDQLLLSILKMVRANEESSL